MTSSSGAGAAQRDNVNGVGAYRACMGPAGRLCHRAICIAAAATHLSAAGAIRSLHVPSLWLLRGFDALRTGHPLIASDPCCHAADNAAHSASSALADAPGEDGDCRSLSFSASTTTCARPWACGRPHFRWRPSSFPKNTFPRNIRPCWGPSRRLRAKRSNGHAPPLQFVSKSICQVPSFPSFHPRSFTEF